MLGKLILSFLFLVSMFPISLQAATPQDCAVFLQKGWVYDRDSVFLTRDDFQLVQTYFSHNTFHSKKQALDASAGLNIPILDVLDLDFKGHLAESEYDQWQDALLHTTYTEISQKLQYVHAMQKVSKGLTDTLQACLHQGGLSFVLIPGAGFNTFTLQAIYVPTTGESQGKGSVSFQPSSAVHCNQRLTNQVINAAGFSWLCSRRDGTDITVVLNSRLGTRNVSFPSHNSPPPTASLTASPTSVEAGQATTLTWKTSDAKTVLIVPDVGNVNVIGSIQVTPSQDTVYRLTAIGEHGHSAASTANVKVTPPITVSSIKYSFHTTDNDKDWDTQVGVQLICSNRTIASRFDFNHDENVDHWDDNSDKGPWELHINQPLLQREIGDCKYVVSTTGSDTWNNQAHLSLVLSDGRTLEFAFPPKSYKDQHSETFDVR